MNKVFWSETDLAIHEDGPGPPRAPRPSSSTDDGRPPALARRFPLRPGRPHLRRDQRDPAQRGGRARARAAPGLSGRSRVHAFRLRRTPTRVPRPAPCPHRQDLHGGRHPRGLGIGDGVVAGPVGGPGRDGGGGPHRSRGPRRARTGPRRSRAAVGGGRSGRVSPSRCSRRRPSVSPRSSRRREGRGEVAGRVVGAVADGEAVIAVGTRPMAPVPGAGRGRSSPSRTGRGAPRRAAAGGATDRPRPSLDGARRLAQVSFEPSPATLVASGDEAGVSSPPSSDRAAMGTGAVLLGVADRLITMTAPYALDRIQFGVPIGSFQAVKHHLANALIRAGVRPARRLPGRLVPRQRRPRRRPPRLDGQSPGLRRRHRCRPDRPPGPRGHRLHLGARHPPLDEAGLGLRRLGRRRRPPGPGARDPLAAIAWADQRSWP